tara:strand:- start:629 stop:772 length:144 start_codon:yes stop_codon:yes gene_type:complete
MCYTIADIITYGEVFGTSDSAEDADMEPEDWAEVLQLPRCVVLYPTN